MLNNINNSKNIQKNKLHHCINFLSVQKEDLSQLLDVEHPSHFLSHPLFKQNNITINNNIIYPTTNECREIYFSDHEQENFQTKSNSNIKYKCSFLLSKISDDKIIKEIQELIQYYCAIEEHDKNMIISLSKQLSILSNKTYNIVSNFNIEISVVN